MPLFLNWLFVSLTVLYTGVHLFVSLTMLYVGVCTSLTMLYIGVPLSTALKLDRNGVCTAKLPLDRELWVTFFGSE